MKKVPGHADDWVAPSAPAPWNNQTAYPANPSGDWVQYFKDILTNCIQLQQPPDALALHTYTHGNTSDLIASEQKTDAPFQNYHSHFRTYRDFLSVVPASLKSVAGLHYRNASGRSDLVAEPEHRLGASARMRRSTRGTRCRRTRRCTPFASFAGRPAMRRWSIADKPAVQDDFRAAMQNEYRVRPPAGQPGPPQPPVTTSGWCPFVTKRPITTNNYDVGRSGQKVKAVVLHIAAGSMLGIFPTFNDPNRLASAHFAVAKNGTIEQYVSIDDTAYGVGMRYKDGQLVQSARDACQAILDGTSAAAQSESLHHQRRARRAAGRSVDPADVRCEQSIAAVDCQAVQSDLRAAADVDRTFRDRSGRSAELPGAECPLGSDRRGREWHGDFKPDHDADPGQRQRSDPPVHQYAIRAVQIRRGEPSRQPADG